MSAGYLYKPATSKGPVVLVPSSVTDVPTITLKDGTVIKGTFVNNVEGNRQYKFPSSIINQTGLTLGVGNDKATLGSGASAYQGPSLSSLAPRGKGSVSGAPGADTSGIDPKYQPSQIGYGMAPADIEKLFPKPTHMKETKLDFTDPTAYAKTFQDYVNTSFTKNVDVSKNIALSELNTELEGMQAFVPAAQALQQKTVSADNTFNQEERTKQVNSVLGKQVENLDKQAEDAAVYASGRLPDSEMDKALTLNARGAAADKASVGGFGASSSVARKTSDLLDASQRLDIAKYGNSLVSSNASEEAALKLAPTEYANAGSQIKVTPGESAGARQATTLAALNSYGLLPVQSGLTTTVQQKQVQANFTNDASKTNASIDNTFALSKFGYQANYAGAVAGAAQTDVNTQVGLAQQQQYLQTMQGYQNQSQTTGLIGAGISGVTQAIGSIFGK